MYTKVLKGVLISYGFTLVAFLILALALSFTNLPDSLIPGAILFISVISILVGAASCSKNADTQGFLWGGSVGGIYAVVLYIISSMTLTGFFIPLATIYLILGYVLTGAIGGIVGINLKK